MLKVYKIGEILKFKTHNIYKYVTNCRKYVDISYYHRLGEEPLRAITIGGQLEETARKYGERTAVISKEQKKSLTYNELFELSNKVANGLIALGLQKNDRIGLWAPNLIEWYISMMACSRAGFIMVALNPAYQTTEIKYCINKVGIKAMIIADKFKTQDYLQLMLAIDPNLYNNESKRIQSLELPSLNYIISLGETSNRGVYNFQEILDLGSRNSVVDNQRYVSPDDPCNIQFTSGTTGSPKAALTSHFQLINNAFYVGKRNELALKHHKICVQVPLFHAFGTVITILASLCYGSTLVLPSAGFDPNKSLDVMQEEKCTIIHGTPTMYVDLIDVQEKRKVDLSLEIAVSGGALCSPELFNSMLKILKVKKVKSVYGMTETSAVVFQSKFNESEKLATTTVGQVSEHVEVKVVDEEGKIVPLNTPGELYLRSYSNMLGYWNDEKKTKEMIGEDRWLKTGDQFILLENGYGTVVGRLKDMIIRGGENIFPKEIEEFLMSHPDILEAQVIGVPHKRLGEAVCACLRVKPDVSITLSDIQKYCKGKIAHFKIPSQIHIMDDFPKTTSGKIQKFKLQELISNNKK